MIHSARFTCVLDTNVIFPVEIRDLLFWFAHYDLFTPKWSENILDEWAKVIKKKGGTDEDIENRIRKTRQAFPDAMVENYESLIKTLKLPDEKDRHVLAAAIKTNANLIVTHNLKDFPNDYLAQFGLSAKSPDDFAADLIDLNPKQAIQAFRELVLNRRNPELDEYEVLVRFRKNGLKDTADYLHALL
jgi:predicted nucleic acid-binding protein